MKVVHLALSLNDGAGIAAWRQHLALRAAGVQSRFLVAQPPPAPDPEIAVVGLPALSRGARLARAATALRSPARAWPRERHRIDRHHAPHYEAFSLPFAPFRPEAHPWIEDADLVHLHWIPGFVDYPRFFARLSHPCVWSLHDQNPYLGGFHYDTDLALAPQLAALDRRCRELKRACLAPHRHLVLGNSDWNTAAGRAAGVFPGGTTFETCYYPLDPAVFAPRPRAEAKVTLGLAPDRLVVGFACADLANARKGLPDLVAALQAFAAARNRSDFTVLTFGRSPDAASRSAVGAEWRHLGFLHADEVKAAAYSAMDVFVAPSRAEAFGQTVIEASACGTPVIGTRVGGIVEALAPELRPLAVSPAAPAAIAAALGTLAADASLRAELGAAARRHVVQQHHPAVVGARMRDLYRGFTAAAPVSPTSRPVATGEPARPTHPRALLYCWPQMFVHDPPGLGHMKEIARTLLREATRAGRVALLPPLRSNRFHNLGRTGFLRWADYYDWSSLPVHEPVWQRRDDLLRLTRGHASCALLGPGSAADLHNADADLVVRLFPNPDIFGAWLGESGASEDTRLGEPSFSNFFPTAIAAHAAAAIRETGAPDGVLHVRRGDLACPASEPAAVVAYLSAHGATPAHRIVILTDERSPEFGPAIRRTFPSVIVEHEIAYLRGIRRRGVDNYAVFRICKCIQSRHDRLGLGSLRVVPPGGGSFPRPAFPTRAADWLRRKFVSAELVTPEWLAAAAGLQLASR
jgi:glycosyltransferase involved in cell wall biosynthesis